MNLICIPHAGGSSFVFSQWKKKIHHRLNLTPIKLAGRGVRYKEDFYEDIDHAVEDIYAQIQDVLNEDYVLFGHSMGALIAYELTLHIQKNTKKKMPHHVFLSGREAPHLSRVNTKNYSLPDEQFKRFIMDFSGTPSELLENESLYKEIQKVLRKDFKIIDEYDTNRPFERLKCDISIINGEKDYLTVRDILSWKEYTHTSCQIYMMEGGHFYIHNCLDHLLDIINRVSLHYLETSKSV